MVTLRQSTRSDCLSRKGIKSMIVTVPCSVSNSVSKINVPFL